MAGIRKNFLYSSILTVANYIFPLITYPYVSRVLGVTNIGICNFIDSIINYYVLFSMMGILAVGIRETAAAAGNRHELSRTFSGLLCLSGISTAVVLAALAVSVFTVPKLHEYKEMMFVGAFKVLFSFLTIEWFYKGIENFRFITCYGMLTRCLYVAGVFIFVRDSSDYETYYLLSVLMIVVSAAINLWHSRKFVRFTFAGLEMRRYLVPFIVLGIYLLLTSMYTTFNVAWLGFVCGETEVGYYTTATKLHAIFLALFTAFTGVMMPRISSLVAAGDMEQVKALLGRSFHLLYVFSIPVIIFTVVFAPDVILFISGPGYEQAVTPMRIVMPLILVIGYEQIAIIQVLMPMKKDRPILLGSCAGAIVGIMANVLLVGTLGCNGSALVWALSETVVFVLANCCLVRYVQLKLPVAEFVKYTMWAVPAFILAAAVNNAVSGYMQRLAAGGFVVAVYYTVLYVAVLKDGMVISLIEKARGIIRHSR